MKKTFIIEYTVMSKEDKVIKKGKMKAKNKLSEMDAQVKFEKFLIKKHDNFGKLIVHKCYEELDFIEKFDDMLKGTAGDLGDIFKGVGKGFGDIFGGKKK